MTAREPDLADTQDRLVFLDGLRAVAMLLVVGVHGTGYVPLEGATEHWVNFVVHTISVPTFFLCDGYLLARRRMRGARDRYTSYLAMSARRLLVPWAVFSALYTATRGLFEAIGVLDERMVIDQSLGAVLLRVYGSDIAPQMYFLPSLFLIRCGAPAWRRLSATPVAVQLAVFILYATFFRSFASEFRELLSAGNDPIRHAFWGLQFYLAGCCLHRLEPVLRNMHGYLALTSLVLLAGMLGADWGPRWALQYAYLLLAFFIFAALPRVPRLLAAAGRDTMGIYLLHTPVVLKICGILVLSTLSASLASYVIVCLAAFCGSWLATRALMKLPHGPALFGIFGPSRV